MTESEWFEQLFNRLSHSKFRSSFHLKQKEKEYIQAKGNIGVQGVQTR